MKYIFFLISFSIFFVGCSSKLVYKPKGVDSSLSYTKTLPSKLVDVTREGGTYEDGVVVSKQKGLLSFKLPKGYTFIHDCDGFIISSSGDGKVLVTNTKGEKIFEKGFENQLASATIKGNLLAMLFVNNMIMLYDISKDSLIYKEPLSRVVAVDERVANPLFLNDLVIFPTLDGRLLFMDSKRKLILRDVAISNKELFNNVIFLSVNDNTLVAATASKIISIDPKQIHNKEVDIKDVIYQNHKIYLFTKSGHIVLLDESLKKLKEIEFPYAVFSAVFDGDKLYCVEKNGYLIEVDKNLQNYSVVKLPDLINVPVFARRDEIYFGNRIIEFR